MRAASRLAAPVNRPEAPPAESVYHHEWMGRPLDGWAAALDPRRVEHVLLVFLGFAAVVPILYLARSVDGNALTSWRWTFSGPRALLAVLVLVPAMLAALALSRAPLRGRAAPAIVACAAAAAVVPLWAEPELVLDASRYLVQAKFLEAYGVGHFLREWGRGIDAWTDLPLVPFLVGLAFSAAGESRACAQALDTALFGATLLLTARVGRMLWDEDTGLDAAILLLGIPSLLVQVPLLLVDVPSMALLALSACAFLWVAQRGGALRAAAAGLAAAAAAFAKYSLWPMLAVVAAGAALSARADRRRAAARIAAALLVAGLLVGAAAAARPEVLQRQLRLLATFQWSGLGRWREGFLSTFAFQTHPLVTALALLGLARAAAARDARFLVLAGALAMAVPLGSARARYAVPLLPFVALAASRGLAAVRDVEGRRLLGLCAVAGSLVVAYGAYLPFLRQTSFANLARAGRVLDALDGPAVEVRALPQRGSSGSTFAAIPLLGYATRKAIVSPEPWPVRGDDPATRTSSLRFSWEMRRPPFYAGRLAPGVPLAVISSDAGEPPPAPGLREVARFAGPSEDIFRYRTVVTIYRRDPGI